MKIKLILFFVILASCQNNNQLTKKQYYIFGTIIEVLIWHNDKNQTQMALNAVEKALNGMHNQWHAWKPGRLNQINLTLRSEKPFKLNQEESQFIQQTAILAEESLGYFNPAIGELINLWGFHSDVYPIMKPPPADNLIKEFLEKAPSMEDITINENTISSKNKHIWLDFGGIAKGYAIDKAINILKNHGISNAIVNAGGDLRSIGTKGNENWKVAIRKPNSKNVVATLYVKEGESIFTSGNYERYKEFNGKRYAHIIDPTTGYGVNQIVSATVIAENGTKADAAATALIVAGIENWKKVMQSMKLDQVLLIDENGQCYASKKIKQRLKNTQLECQ